MRAKRPSAIVFRVSMCDWTPDAKKRFSSDFENRPTIPTLLSNADNDNIRSSDKNKHKMKFMLMMGMKLDSQSQV